MHIQKLIYIAQELEVIPPAYDFVLYQRGPYSFGLDSDIRELRSFGAVDIRPAPPYGPTYEVTALGEKIGSSAPIDAQAANRLRDLSKRLGIKQAKDLELLATTLFAMEEGKTAKEDIITRVSELKPQFKREPIEQAVSEVNNLKSSFPS